MKGRVSVNRTIQAPIERVWQAWTDPDKLKQWFSSQTDSLEVIEFDLKPQGKVRLKAPGDAGEYTWTYVKINEPNSLVFDILDYSLPAHPDGVGGTCYLDLKEVANGTEITVSGDLPSESLREKYQKLIRGWDTTLRTLDKFLQKET
jgi:uncharacterized protein YndB with AHSA1/START domain